MIKILLPVILIALGAGAGIGAGLYLQPAPEVTASSADKSEDEAEAQAADKAKDASAAAKPAKELGPGDKPEDVAFEYARLKNQFVVPIIRGEEVQAIVVIAISLEVQTGSTDDVYVKEPRLRDSFLQAMFDHAAIGGFDGAFVNNQNLRRLRNDLRERAYATLGSRVNDVLITHIARQDT